MNERDFMAYKNTSEDIIKNKLICENEEKFVDLRKQFNELRDLSQMQNNQVNNLTVNQKQNSKEIKENLERAKIAEARLNSFDNVISGTKTFSSELKDANDNIIKKLIFLNNQAALSNIDKAKMKKELKDLKQIVLNLKEGN